MLENKSTKSKKTTTTENKIVNPPKWVRLINFNDYLFRPKKDTDFTSLSERQQSAIKNIEKYWTRRVKNYNNWKSQKHWSYKKESISSRVEEHLYLELKQNNNNRSIQNFMRHFLRDARFRNKYLQKLYKQFELDPYDPQLALLDFLDITDRNGLLIEIFPKVVSGEITTIEKELFTFYSTFLCDFSMSYMIRVALIHFRDEPNQKPIDKEEVINILINLLIRKKEVEENENQMP